MVTITLAIDRVEDGVAICIDEEGKTCDMPFYRFPQNAAEGSIVECVFEGNDLVSAKVVKGKTAARKTENEKRLHALFAKSRKPSDN